MTKSFCHFDTIPSDMMDIIEADLTDTFDEQMQTSRLMGNAEVLEKRNSTNAWVPTTYWIGGLIWHYFKRANDEEELLDTVFGDDFDDKDGLEVPDFLK